MSNTAAASQTSDLTTPTPALWLELNRLEANIRSMHGHLHALGVTLRPHLKTCKSIDVARLLLAAGAERFTVSTLAEARYFLAHGLTDLLYAVGIAPGKLAQCSALMQAGLKLTITLDSAAAARAVAEAANRHACRYRVLLEIDCDGERAGFAPDAAALIDAATTLEKSGCHVDGIMTHAGGSYHCRRAGPGLWLWSGLRCCWQGAGRVAGQTCQSGAWGDCASRWPTARDAQVSAG
jgi:D-serine deaminase-like pyridoxal phosphate-dependent protein